MIIINKAVKELTLYAKNAKKHDKRQVENVAKSIEEYGFVQPVVIDKNGVIVIGHCRVLAAKQLGMKEVPCVCVDDLTPEQVNALRLVDNKSNESEWDMDLLAAELDDVDLSEFEFEWGLINPDDYDDEFELRDGDKAPVQTMSFTFSDTEAETIKDAIAKMKKSEKFEKYENPQNMNSNGNALFLVVEEWLRQKK